MVYKLGFKIQQFYFIRLGIYSSSSKIGGNDGMIGLCSWPWRQISKALLCWLSITRFVIN